MNRIILLVAAVGVLTGCDFKGRNDPETISKNQVNANFPEFVADTPKGKLYRIWINMGSQSDQDRVYYFDTDTNSVTVNSTIKAGKTFHTQASLIINGVEYVPKK